MNKFKKVFFRILIISFSLFIFLFIVQLIDQAINGKMYAKIDAFTKKESYIGKRGNGKICSNKGIYIMKNTLGKIVDTSVVQIAPEFKNSLIYDDAIDSCKLALQDYSELKVPNNISQRKIIFLKDNINLRKQLMRQYITYLEEIKNCHGNKACLIKSTESFPDQNFTLLSLKYSLNTVKIYERFSIKSIFFGQIAKLYIKNKINKIEREVK